MSRVLTVSRLANTYSASQTTEFDKRDVVVRLVQSITLPFTPFILYPPGLNIQPRATQGHVLYHTTIRRIRKGMTRRGPPYLCRVPSELYSCAPPKKQKRRPEQKKNWPCISHKRRRGTIFSQVLPKIKVLPFICVKEKKGKNQFVCRAR